jgi:hypothetical protein
LHELPDPQSLGYGESLFLSLRLDCLELPARMKLDTDFTAWFSLQPGDQNVRDDRTCEAMPTNAKYQVISPRYSSSGGASGRQEREPRCAGRVADGGRGAMRAIFGPFFTL